MVQNELMITVSSGLLTVVGQELVNEIVTENNRNVVVVGGGKQRKCRGDGGGDGERKQ